MPIVFSKPLRSASFEGFVIQTLSNWGGDHTCLAPFRFYVRDADGASVGILLHSSHRLPLTFGATQSENRCQVDTPDPVVTGTRAFH